MDLQQLLAPVDENLLVELRREWDWAIPESLQVVGLALPRNHCVGFKTPPAMGGLTDASNVEIVPVSTYQRWTGRVLRAMAAVPPGRQVTGVDVGDDGSVSVRWR